ncbi:MAG: DUF1292 domain-containing protein [Clostridiaceae bacterium]|nr:DUF1292 domain-containing protein [Oscillospiraceae bacterium]NLO62757.1 DUF1292 domain-containing protein [Clostridiaceae bacterium]
MKTKSQKKNKTEKRIAAPQKSKKTDGAMAVIRDVINSKEYYLSIIDSFMIEGREYVVMYNYEPDDGNHAEPELVIMRTEFSQSGDQLFYSIRDNNELHRAFIIFMRRFHSSHELHSKRVKSNS